MAHQSKPSTTAPTKVELSGDDAIFLVWVLGFTAGANLERDGERGERIFGRCRQLHEKIAPIGVPFAAAALSKMQMGGLS